MGLAGNFNPDKCALLLFWLSFLTLLPCVFYLFVLGTWAKVSADEEETPTTSKRRSLAFWRFGGLGGGVLR